MIQTSITQSLSSLKRTISADYIPALTGIRAVAAYLVFWHHHNPARPGTFTHQLINQGYIGVSVFFVLSGFLIYHRYANEYFAQENWSWRRYLAERFHRIFPLYFITLLLTISLRIAFNQPISWRLTILNLTLLNGLFTSYKFSGIPQSWSLTVEICFYLLAPFLFVVLKRWGIFLLTAYLWGIGLLFCWLSSSGKSELFTQLQFIAFYTFFGRGFDFIVGMQLARRWDKKQLPDFSKPIHTGLIISIICLLWQAIASYLNRDSYYAFWNEFVVYNYIFPLGISLFFQGLLIGSSGINHWLSLPIMQALGRSSYAFYLIHNGVITTGLQKAGLTQPWLLFLMLIALAHGLHIYFEKVYKEIGNWICRK
ncbi:acyltransferase family protein [Spirosoma harenae]